MAQNKFNERIPLPSNESKDKFSKPILSSITSIIGRGEDARNSFVYLTLKWTFITGCFITFLVVINHWLFRKTEKVPDFTNDIEIVWDIAVPIITLALGYAFGKSRD